MLTSLLSKPRELYNILTISRRVLSTICKSLLYPVNLSHIVLYSTGPRKVLTSAPLKGRDGRPHLAGRGAGLTRRCARPAEPAAGGVPPARTGFLDEKAKVSCVFSSKDFWCGGTPASFIAECMPFFADLCEDRRLKTFDCTFHHVKGIYSFAFLQLLVALFLCVSAAFLELVCRNFAFKIIFRVSSTLFFAVVVTQTFRTGHSWLYSCAVFLA